MLKFHWTGSLIDLHSPFNLLKNTLNESKKSFEKVPNDEDIFQCELDEGMISDLNESLSEDDTEVRELPHNNNKNRSSSFHKHEIMLNSSPDLEQQDSSPVMFDKKDAILFNLRDKKFKNIHKKWSKNSNMPNSLPASLEFREVYNHTSVLNEIFQDILQHLPNSRKETFNLERFDSDESSTPTKVKGNFDTCSQPSSELQEELAHRIDELTLEPPQLCISSNLETNDCVSSKLSLESSFDSSSCSSQFEDSGCSSYICDFKTLMSTKQSPSKKKVRFADEEGQILANVKVMKSSLSDMLPRTTLDDREWISPITLNTPRFLIAPLSLPDHENFSFSSDPPKFYLPNTCFETKIICTCLPWQPTFAQPAAQYMSFRKRIESNNVALENIAVDFSQSTYLSLQGTIKVKNIDFEKKVWLRVSTNDWKSCLDYSAYYNATLSTCDVRFDTFSFLIKLDRSFLEEKVEFAVGFRGGNSEFWDNNEGSNFIIKQFSSHKHFPHCMEKVYNQIIPTTNQTHDIFNIDSNSFNMNFHSPWNSFNDKTPYY